MVLPSLVKAAVDSLKGVFKVDEKGFLSPNFWS